MRKFKHLTDAYRFKSFTPGLPVQGIFGDPKSLIIRLKRRGKKLFVRLAAWFIKSSMTARYAEFGIYPAVTGVSFLNWKSGVFSAAGAAW
jgi:hypothetical protein